MSEEEKKAIEYLKENSKEGSSFWCYEAIPNIKKVLKLIDKQQKEINRLQNIKRKDIQDLINNENENIYKNYISKDKIRECIQTPYSEVAIENIVELLEENNGK